jgi:hypothetical protein
MQGKRQLYNTEITCKMPAVFSNHANNFLADFFCEVSQVGI